MSGYGHCKNVPYLITLEVDIDRGHEALDVQSLSIHPTSTLKRNLCVPRPLLLLPWYLIRLSIMHLSFLDLATRLLNK